MADLRIGGGRSKAKLSVRAQVSSGTVSNESFSYSSVHSTSTISVAPRPASPSMPLPSKLLGRRKTSFTSKTESRHNGSVDPKFSTADRKILEELKLNISAREAQFVKKGTGVSFGRNGVGCGKKHHPYSRRDVPYPRSYEREVLDLDVWETAFCHDACGSITWHVFKTPPTRVLDLGCGTGSWILSSAKVWKDCRFVGLDIVPLHPDLQQIGSPDLAARITWVQANFLEKLPFPDEEFDYVHIKRISLGVPEDKWDSLLEEITRVMKPGAAFELIEEDLFFPGKQVDSDSDSELEGEEIYHGTSYSSSTLMIAEDRRSADTLHIPVRTEDEYSTPTASVLPTAPSRPGSPVPIREAAIAEETDGEDVVRYSELTSSPSRSARTPTRPSLQVKTSHESWHQGHRPPMPKRSTSTLSLPTPKSAMSSTARAPEGKGLASNTNVSHVPMPVPVTPVASVEELPPEMLRTLPKPPNNPRDHTILETIYTEMLSSRFINTSPLSLLGSSLSLYFKDLRTHPAIQFTFPPLPPRKYRVFGKVQARTHPGEVGPKDHVPSDDELLRYDDVVSEVEEKSRFLSMQALLQHESRYVSLDETRPTAFSPAARVNFSQSTRELKMTAIRRGSRLPNGQLHLDLKALNLHLALRVEEVLACAESMWEWVEEQQRIIRNQETNRLMNIGGLGSRPRTSNDGKTTEENFKDRIAAMRRIEFDELLTNFKLDMQDQYMLGYALQDRFDWAISLCLPPPERIIFDSASEKWRQWETQERYIAEAAMQARQSSSYTRPRAISSSNLSNKSSSFSTYSLPQVTRAQSGQSSHSNQSGQSGQSNGNSTLTPPQGERWDQQSLKQPLRSVDAKTGYVHDGSMDTLLVNTKDGRPRGVSRASQSPPTRKLSRALKIFVGWKP